MNDFEHYFIHIKNTLKLTEGERALMRSNIEARMDAPAVSAPIVSPFAIPLFAFLSRPAPAFAFLLIIALVGGTTTAAAAETALPGDSLYSVKININEKVEQAFALSALSKANLEIRHAEERLREIELLAASGKDERIAHAAREAGERIASARARLASLIVLHPDTQGADSELASALSAHADIIDAQAIERSDDTGLSMSALARTIRGDDSRLDATAERAQKIVEKAKKRIDRNELPSEAYEALASELALIEGELTEAEARGSVRGFALAERHAYRVLALAESTERIADKTGKHVFIGFSARPGESDALKTARAKESAEDTGAATSMMAVFAPESDDSLDDTDDDEDEDDERTLEFRVLDHESDRDRDDDEDDKDSSGTGNGGNDEDDDHSGSGGSD